MKPLTRDEVTFTIECEHEYDAVRGNALASGDDEADKECEDEIIDRINRGDRWAWCCVKVTAKWEGLTADTCLGHCSYEDEADFRKGGYFDDMCEQTLEELNTLLKRYQRPT